MSERLLHFFLSDDRVQLDDDKGDEPKLLWKVVLRTGTWKMRPGPGGIKLDSPLKIYRDKAPKGHISMSELVKNFEAGAKENVTTPAVHADGTISDSGFVRKLVIQDVAGEDGSGKKQSLLWAGLEITDSEVSRKVKEKSIVGVSGGVLFDYQRPRDAKKFGQILSHVMFTNSPWIDGTGGFKDKLPDGVMASEPDDLPVGELEFSDDDGKDPQGLIEAIRELVGIENSPPIRVDPPGSPAHLQQGDPDPPKKDQPAPGAIVWKPTEGFAWIKGKLQRALEEQRRMLMTKVGREEYYRIDYPYYSVDDVQGDGSSGKALVCSGYGPEKESWVANYKIEDSEEGHDLATIEPFQDWTPAKPEWVAASEQPPPASSAGRQPDQHAAAADLSDLRRAQMRRAEAVGLGRHPTTNGGTMGNIMDMLQGVDLTDDVRAQLEQEEADRARRDQETKDILLQGRENRAKAINEKLKGLGLETPGLQAYVRNRVICDDGGPALELSEETESGQRTQPKGETVTEIIEGFVDAIPKDEQGRVTLSQQAARLPGDGKPPEGEEPPPPGDGDKPVSKEEARTRSDALLQEAREQGLELSATPDKPSDNGGGS